MENVVGIKFNNSNKIYYFNTCGLTLNLNDKVLVETEKGIQLGSVNKLKKTDDDKILKSLKNILRIATKEDLLVDEDNKNSCVKALVDAKNIADKLKLNMRFVNASYTFDKKQLIFNFVSDERVDFRELARKLAAIYKTRIELRQIGVRDKAKDIGGIGPCGRILCCSNFLTDFNSVSINMAKNQYIALNPTKINGVCGRLLCCLNYEDEQYTEMKKDYPTIGTIIKKKDVNGKVISHNLFKKTYTIENKNGKTTEVNIKNESSK